MKFKQVAATNEWTSREIATHTREIFLLKSLKKHEAAELVKHFGLMFSDCSIQQH